MNKINKEAKKPVPVEVWQKTNGLVWNKCNERKSNMTGSRVATPKLFQLFNFKKRGKKLLISHFPPLSHKKKKKRGRRNKYAATKEKQNLLYLT